MRAQSRNTFLSTSATTTNPHQCIEEGVSLIASLHGKIDAIFVAARVYTISRIRVVDLVKNILGSGKPAFSTDNDKSGWFLGRLEQIAGTQVGC